MTDEHDINDLRRLIADRADRRTRPPATDRVDLATGWELAQHTEVTVTELDAHGVTTTTETLAVSPLLLGIEPPEGNHHE
ncbi:hypothetical protein [Dietzia sp. CH92]|uniref:hypothetical protein n=1 Tax=Dietzia sp. CH92 TaxID=3051823 RepID=UPI0028D5295E|nr:hypothetical protein [Dietzia sp. CH92]